jgi:hypothetical protein
MSLTYKKHKDGLLFSNGNYVSKVYDQYGNWTYNFAAKHEESDAYIDDQMLPEVTKHLQEFRTDNWLTF